MRNIKIDKIKESVYPYGSTVFDNRTKLVRRTGFDKNGFRWCANGVGDAKLDTGTKILSYVKQAFQVVGCLLFVWILTIMFFSL